MRRLRGEDAHFLYEESRRRPAHTLKLLMLDGDPGTEAVRDVLRAGATRHWLLRARPLRVPGGLFHPVWIDGGTPDVAEHVAQVTVAPPGGESELAALAGTLAAGRLPRDRPLWKAWHATGLTGGRSAIVLQLHHALADGPAASALLGSVLGPPPAAAAGDTPPGSMPGPAAAAAGSPPAATADAAGERPPSAPRLVRDALGPLARTVASLPRLLARGALAGRQMRELRTTGTATPVAAFASPPTPWSGPLTPRRACARASLPMADVDVVRATAGASVTEVLLAAVGIAIEGHLAARAITPARPLTAAVPVSRRGADRSPPWGNRFGVLACTLGEPAAPAAERLAAVRASLAAGRAAWVAGDPELIGDAWEAFPLMRAAQLASIAVARRTHRRPTFSVVVSSVRGPASSLTLAGVPVTAIFSTGQLDEDIGLNVTAWDYDGRLNVTILTDPQAADPADLAARIPAALASLRDDR